MFCGLRLSRVSTTRVTRSETGIDEIFFAVTGGPPSAFLPRREIRRWQSDPDIWEMGPNQSVQNIILWEGFIPENQTAILQVEIQEQETFSNELIGRLSVSIRAQNPNPVIEWFAPSRFTSITGPTVGEATTISAGGSGALYQINAVVDRSRTITSVNSGKCLDVEGASMDNNANVQQFTCLGNANQKWYIKKVGPVYAGGTPFPDTRQFWNFAIHAEHSGKCLDVEAAGPETNVQQFDCKYGPNQRWLLVPTSQPNEFFIINTKQVGSNFGLDVANASTEDHANVQIHPFHGDPNQKWRIDPAPVAHSLSPYDFFSFS